VSATLKPASSEVVVAAPMSFAGSAQRIWKLTKASDSAPAIIALSILAIGLILGAWAVVFCWYGIFGILLVPYRLIRRGQRKDRRNAMRHEETLSTMAAQHAIAAQQLAQQMAAPVAIDAAVGLTPEDRSGSCERVSRPGLWARKDSITREATQAYAGADHPQVAGG